MATIFTIRLGPELTATINPEGLFGAVEGFYWKKEDAYHKQYGEYTHVQRRGLLRFMGSKGLNVYVYDPKIVVGKPEESGRKQRAVELLSGESLKEWQETFKLAKELKIEFIWGLTPPDFSEGTQEKLINVVEQLTHLTDGAAGVALLMDDVPGGQRTLSSQAKLVQDLWDRFNNKIKGYCPTMYSGEPEEIEQTLRKVDQIVPKSVPFIFTGKAVWARSIKYQDLPCFNDRKIILWDNWIASDKLRLENFYPLPPPKRERQLLKEVSGYWLNLSFPVERVIPTLSSISFLQENRRSPDEKSEAEELLLGEGGIADEWAKEMECSSDWTRAVLKIKLHDIKAAINPVADDIVESSDLHSIELLLQIGFNLNTEIRAGKSMIQLAVDQGNYPFAVYLHQKKARDEGIDWPALKETWERHFAPSLLPPEKSNELRWDIIGSIDQYDLLSLQSLLAKGVSVRTKNSKGKSLAEIARWHRYNELAAYLEILEDAEKNMRIIY